MESKVERTSKGIKPNSKVPRCDLTWKREEAWIIAKNERDEKKPAWIIWSEIENRKGKVSKRKKRANGKNLKLKRGKNAEIKVFESSS